MNRPTLVLLAALLVAIPLSLVAGRASIFALDDARALLIVLELRLPRALLAVSVGAGLGAAGAAMQGYLRNPLADPGLFGIAPGAALGAVLSFSFGYAASGWLLPIFALAGAGGAMALLALMAGRGGGIAAATPGLSGRIRIVYPVYILYITLGSGRSERNMSRKGI